MDRLDDVVIALGAVDGYSGDDLTNPRDAALRGEVPYLPSGTAGPGTRPLELRVHGVGGAPPADNLETPNTVQVAGDGSAGFFRPWHPGGTPHPDEPRREAYCWGKLNVGSWTRALWLMLVAFMIVNVAYFALPRVGAGAQSRFGNAVCRAVLRLLGLAITLAFVGTTITVLADLAAWQAPRRGTLPSWLHWFGDLGGGPRLSIALVVTLAVLAGLAGLSRTTAAAYEAWDPGTFATEDPRWPLTSRQFWCGERTVSRQRDCHVVAGAGEVVFVAAMPHSSALGLRVVLIAVAAALAGLATVLTASPWTDRRHVAGRPARGPDTAMHWTALGAGVLAGAVAIARIWWQPDDPAHALPGSQPLQTFVVFVIFGLLALLAGFVLLARPWRQPDVMGKGWAAVLLATLGTVIATIFGAAFTLAIANLLGRPRVTFCGKQCGGDLLYLPSTVFAGGLGMIAALALVLMFAGFALAIHRPRVARRYLAEVGKHYPQPGGPRSARAVAKTWAAARLTDLAAPALAVIAVPTALVALAYQVWLAATDRPGAHWLQTTAAFGGTVGVLAIGYFLVQLRSALVAAQARKRFGIIWDVGTFFPRACAPFAPPCYAERSVPEVVSRIRRVVGDEIRGPGDPAAAIQLAEQADGRPGDPREAHTGVLLVGYSQGTPISVAVLAQLPADIIDRTALLTLAAPVRRLYGRTFPAYFGAAELAVLCERLTCDGTVRWRNLVRRSDYIGGWVLEPPGPTALLDTEISDPPVLWSDDDPTPPPTHRHSDWFPDPQTRPYADEMALRIN